MGGTQRLGVIRRLSVYDSSSVMNMGPCHPEQTAVFTSLDLHGSSPEFSDLWHKFSDSKKRICSHSEGWWHTPPHRPERPRHRCIQGYLADKKQPPPGTLQ